MTFDSFINHLKDFCCYSVIFFQWSQHYMMIHRESHTLYLNDSFKQIKCEDKQNQTKKKKNSTVQFNKLFFPVSLLNGFFLW